MWVGLVILCAGIANADEPPKIADSEVAASEESQWTPFFSEASRASEGLPWGSISPALASDDDPPPSGRQATYPDPMSSSSGRQETYSNFQSATSNRQETYPNPTSGRQETYPNPTSGRQETYPNLQSATPNQSDHLFEPSDRGDSLTKDRKDVHKVTITKKVRVPYKVHVEKHIPKIIEVPVDKPFNVYVPKPYPVVVEKKVPYEIKVHQPQPYTVEKRVPYPVKVLVDKPYTLHVPKPYPVDVEKKYEFTVEKKIPYEVKVPVERPYPVHVIVEKEVKFPVETKVPVPVKVPYEKPIPIHVTKHVPVNVDKPVPYSVEKVATYPVKVPFRIPIKMHFPEGGSVEEVPRDVQNLEWAEAMNSATGAAKLEPRPSQWYTGTQGMSHFQGESQRPSLEQGEYHNPSQSHAEPQKPPQYHSLYQRPTHIRQGFSAGRGRPTRNGYLLSKHAYKRPTTKLQLVGQHYEVKEAQAEQYPTAPFLNQPGSEVIVPQMVLADSPPVAESQHPNAPNRDSQQSNALSSIYQPSHPQNLPQQNSASSGFQIKPSTNAKYQQGSAQFGFSNSMPEGISSPMLSNPQTFIGHQNGKNGAPSFSIMNVVHHSGTPSHQSVIHHRTPYVLSNPNPPQNTQVAQLQYLTHNSVGSESSRLPSATFYKPAQNNSAQTYRTKTTPNAQTKNSALTPFGTSGFTISFRSPPSAQQQALASPQPPQQQPHVPQTSPQPSQQQPHVPQTSPQLFKPTTGSQSPQKNDRKSSSYVGSKTVREGQELTYSTSIHHSQNSPIRSEQT